MASATILLLSERMESGEWFAWSEDTPGCWGTGPTKQAAEDDYADVLGGWWQLKTDNGDHDLPPVDLTLIV